MANRLGLLSPAHRSILQANNNNSEKENQRQSTVILHSRCSIKECSDSDSEECIDNGKRRRIVPNYVTNSDGAHPRRRTRQHPHTTPPPTNTAVPSHVIARRNERERNRVRQVNESFAVLRSRIPDYLYEGEAAEDSGKNSRKKLSKVETLRLAVDYIQQLEVLLDIKDDVSCGNQFDDDRFQFFGSETQGSSLKTESEAESDIMDLSSDHRSPTNDIISFAREGNSSDAKSASLKFKTVVSTCNAEEEFPSFESVKMEGMESLDQNSSDGDHHSSTAGSPLPPMSESFPTKSLSLNYSDLYVPYGLIDLSTKCD